MIQKVKLEVTHSLVKASGDKFELAVETELNLAAGVHGIFGGSGQGKSTLLQICAGLRRSDASKISWLNADGSWLITDKAESSPCVYQSQEVVLFEHLTVEQNLDFVMKHSNWSAQTRSFTKTEVIDWCGLSSLLSQACTSLSGGEKQRVGLARSLLSGKPVVILDEPFSALDWQNRLSMLQLLQRLATEHELRFILVSHSLRELALCCQYLINLEKGRVVRAGAVNQVIQSFALTSEEPLFSRLELVNPKPLTDYHLLHWQLKNSQQSIYLKANTASTATSNEMTSKVVAVEADKVSLSLVRSEHSSMLNQLSGTIVKIQPFQHLVLITIDVGGQELLSLVSQLSSQKLKLSQGQSIYAQFKAV